MGDSDNHPLHSTVFFFLPPYFVVIEQDDLERVRLVRTDSAKNIMISFGWYKGGS